MDKNVRRKVNIINETYDFTQDNEKRKKGNTVKPVHDWKVQDFIAYFNDQYTEKVGAGGHSISEKVRAMLKHLIHNRQNNELIKNYIDIFLDNPVVFETRDLYSFLSPWNQSNLDYYMSKGKFKEKKGQKVERELSEAELKLVERMKGRKIL